MNGLTRRQRLGTFLLLCGATLAIQSGCGKTPANRKKSAVPSQPAVELTSENFQREVLDSKQPVMVDFWAPWCGPCVAFGPTVEELAAEFDGRAVVGKLNVDDEPDLADRYEISGIPTVLIFKDGKIAERYVGGSSKEALSLRLNGLMPAVSEAASPSKSIAQQDATDGELDQSVDYTTGVKRGRRRGASANRY